MSSFQVSSERPFYAEHAAAYDALITDPADPWVQAVHAELSRSGLSPARVLDAGCGTGRHAEGLLALGHDVELLDASADLLAIAQQRCPAAPAHHRDICTLNLPHRVDAVMCRGVLNDLLTDTERNAALSCFADVLADRGMLILDVRETEASRARNDGTLRRVEVELGTGARLTFSSRPTWRDAMIEVEEQYHLEQPDGSHTTSSYEFRMRPWTVPELHQRLTAVGLGQIEVTAGHGGRAHDRLFVVARGPVR